ncbi:PC-esterase domain-containing protein 1A-like isoform 2-T3 [Acanthopagrus schlegelii]
MGPYIKQSQAWQLLFNKFVLVLGDSVQRSIYKDLVLLLQRDQYLTLPQLKSKGEFSFESDTLVEGGRLGPMTNGTEYREVRQYRSDHHLLRFYFLTQIYSPYMESILEDLSQGLKPDFIIISSCAWDITRYGRGSLELYKQNLHKFFGQIKTIVCHDCLILWNLTMPLGKKIKGGFLVPEVSHLRPTLSYDIIEANFYSSRLAEAYGLDVLDLHFHFRLRLLHRMPDDVHWDALAHRRISTLLLQHAAAAWGVDLHVPLLPPGQDREVNIRPLLAPTQLANQPGRTAGHHYGGVDQPMRDPLQLPPFRQQSSAAGAVGPFYPQVPMQHYPRPPAGNWRFYRRYDNPFPPANPWLGPQVHHQVGGQSAAGGEFRFCPHFQAHECYMRRRRRRPNIRTHPYFPQPPQGAPIYPAYGWWWRVQILSSFPST